MSSGGSKMLNWQFYCPTFGYSKLDKNSLLAESMVSMMNVREGITSSYGKHSLIVSTACQLVNVIYLFYLFGKSPYF